MRKLRNIGVTFQGLNKVDWNTWPNRPATLLRALNTGTPGIHRKWAGYFERFVIQIIRGYDASVASPTRVCINRNLLKSMQPTHVARRITGIA
jgi:hypothetical protein